MKTVWENVIKYNILKFENNSIGETTKIISNWYHK